MAKTRGEQLEDEGRKREQSGGSKEPPTRKERGEDKDLDVNLESEEWRKAIPGKYGRR